MNTNRLLPRLVEELEEELQSEGILALYSIAAWARSLYSSLSALEYEKLNMAALEELKTKLDLELVWMSWPPDLSDVEVVASSVALNFDLGDETKTDERKLALIFKNQ